MYLASFIDTIKGNGRRKLLTLPPGPSCHAALKQLWSAVSQAEAFDFGALHLESAADPVVDSIGLPVERYVMPTLTPDEQEFFRLRAIPFPADYCWYEFTVETPSALLIDASRYRSEGVIRTTRIDFGSNRKSPTYYSGVWCRLAFDDYSRYAFEGDADLVRYMAANPLLSDNPYLAVYLTLMLNSRTTEIENIVPDPKFNRLKKQKGLTPLPPHTVVTIVPKQFRYAKGNNTAGKEIRHMRLHWRRSHMRHFEKQTPNSVWLENLEYNGRKGWHVVTIPRFLVGKREEGEVSHEYRFMGELHRQKPSSSQSTWH
jgi:hypothetical protein